jgi:hypothetical protein
MDAKLRRARIAELRAELATLEAEETAEVMQSTDDDLRSRCQALIRDHQFIEATKLYRKETGSGLREAHDACNAMR